MLDNQVLISYIVDKLGGSVGKGLPEPLRCRAHNDSRSKVNMPRVHIAHGRVFPSGLLILQYFLPI